MRGRAGASYCEDDAESRKELRHLIASALKETRHWLRMMAAAAPDLRDDARGRWHEAEELNLIFAAIKRSAAP